MNFLVQAMFLASLTLTQAQFFPSSFNLISAPAISPSNFIEFAESPGRTSLAHSAVVENAAQEALLPPELLNPFYKNPAIAAGLAKASLITNKEFPVFNRDTEKIHRSEIFKLFRNAGLHSRK